MSDNKFVLLKSEAYPDDTRPFKSSPVKVSKMNLDTGKIDDVFATCQIEMYLGRASGNYPDVTNGIVFGNDIFLALSSGVVIKIDKNNDVSKINRYPSIEDILPNGIEDKYDIARRDYHINEKSSFKHTLNGFQIIDGSLYDMSSRGLFDTEDSFKTENYVKPIIAKNTLHLIKLEGQLFVATYPNVYKNTNEKKDDKPFYKLNNITHLTLPSQFKEIKSHGYENKFWIENEILNEISTFGYAVWSINLHNGITSSKIINSGELNNYISQYAKKPIVDIKYSGNKSVIVTKKDDVELFGRFKLLHDNSRILRE